MKKLFAYLTVAGMLTFGVANAALAQKKDDKAKTETKEEVKKDSTTQAAVDTTKKAVVATENTTAAAPEITFHQALKQKFIEGGAEWMAPILIVLILGLGIVIERIIYLNLSTTNSKKLLEKIEETLKTKGVEGAKELCRNTRGPLASIFYQGLDRYNEGFDMVEKSVVAYGGVQMSRLQTNLGWLGLFIALAPMLGFLGTVIGMVFAFDDIQKAGDISPTVVAGGMKVALLTTVFGLIVAIILQIFYNYLVSKIDSLVNTMEDATITFMDILVKNK